LIRELIIPVQINGKTSEQRLKVTPEITQGEIEKRLLKWIETIVNV